MKLKNILEAQESLSKISQMDLPLSYAYSLSKLIKKCEEELTIFNKLKNDLIVKNGVENEDGNYILKDTDALHEVNSQIEEVLNQEVEGINKISLPKDIKLSAQDLFALENFIEEEV